MRQPDIEIYLKDAEHAAVAAWLEQALGPHGQTLKCTATLTSKGSARIRARRSGLTRQPCGVMARRFSRAS